MKLKMVNLKPKLKTEDDKSIADIASKIFPNLNETLEAVALDGDQKEIFKVPYQ